MVAIENGAFGLPSTKVANLLLHLVTSCVMFSPNVEKVRIFTRFNILWFVFERGYFLMQNLRPSLCKFIWSLFNLCEGKFIIFGLMFLSFFILVFTASSFSLKKMVFICIS